MSTREFADPEWPWDDNGVARGPVSPLVHHLFVVASSRDGGLTGGYRWGDQWSEMSLLVSGSADAVRLTWTNLGAPPEIFPDSAGLDLHSTADVKWLIDEIKYEWGARSGMSMNQSLDSLLEASPGERATTWMEYIEEVGQEEFVQTLYDLFGLDYFDVDDAAIDMDEVIERLNVELDALAAKFRLGDPQEITRHAGAWDCGAHLYRWTPQDPLVSFAWVESNRAGLDAMVKASPDWVEAVAAAVLN